LQGCKPAVCLFALQKRHKQPERYVKYDFESGCEYLKGTGKKFTAGG
jgi:hypothetical protein